MTSWGIERSGNYNVSHTGFGAFGRPEGSVNSNAEAGLFYDLRDSLPVIWAGHRVEADTGLTDMQARWRDTTSGVFLSEDPLSYSAGDTNLYRYAFNSPGNLIDPDGREPISAGTYLGLTAISAGVDTLVEYGFTYFAGTQDEIDSFSWGATFAKNWGINIATAGIGNKLKYGTWLGKAGIGLARETTKRFLAREALEYTIDMGVGTGYDMYTRDESFSTAFGSNAVGSLIGKGVGHGLSAAGRAFPRLNPENYTWRTNTAGMFGGIEAEFDGSTGAINRRIGRLVDMGPAPHVRQPDGTYASVPSARFVRGFRNREEVLERAGNLRNRLKALGYDDVEIGIRGSAVTGVSSKGGLFRWKAAELGPSDIDFFFTSTKLERRLDFLGVLGPERLRPKDLLKIGQEGRLLKDVLDKFSTANLQQLGRKADGTLLRYAYASGLDPFERIVIQ